MKNIDNRRNGEIEDSQLMAQLASGDSRPLGELFKRYGRMVRAATARFAPEISEAELEELVQDVFLVVHDAAHKYQEQNRFKSWLYGIAARKAREWRKRTWLRRRILQENPGECAGISIRKMSTPDVDIDRRNLVEKALARLPAIQREALWLYTVEGFTGEEMSQILGVKLKTIWTRLHRAKKNMAVEMSIPSERTGQEQP